MNVVEKILSSDELIGCVELLLAKNASARLTVKGFSMFPFIRDNDVITISPFTQGNYSAGRIVAFVHPKTRKLVIHRIVGVEKGKYLVKGDNLYQPDGLVPKGDILGYVTKVERNNAAVMLGTKRFPCAIAFLSRIKFFPYLCRAAGHLPLGLKKWIKEKILR